MWHRSNRAKNPFWWILRRACFLSTSSRPYPHPSRPASLTGSTEETNNCLPTTELFGLWKRCNIWCYIFGVMQLLELSKLEASLSSLEPVRHVCRDGQVWLLVRGRKKIWENFRKVSKFSWLFRLSCKATLGALSRSEWETYGFHSYCDHIWVSEWRRRRNSGLKESGVLWKPFRTWQAIFGCLPPSQIWGLLGWVTDLLSALPACSNC